MRTTTDSTLDNNIVKRTSLWSSPLFCFKKNRMKVSKYELAIYLPYTFVFLRYYFITEKKLLY